MPKGFDVVIIGAGPAGLAAAIYAAREELKTLVVDKSVAGGLAALTGTIENYPGFEQGVSGPDLAEKLEVQAKRFGAEVRIMSEVSAIERQADGLAIQMASGPVTARVALIATGNHHRRLDVPGEADYDGHGVHYCATCDGPLYRDKVVAVVGGGNSAMQEGLFLTKFASKVIMLVRGKALKGTELLIEKVQQHPKIEIHYQTAVQKITGDGSLVKAVSVTAQGGDAQIAADAVFIFIGIVPNTAWLRGSDVKLDKAGFILANENLMSSMEGVFVAGDVRSGSLFQLASVVGDGVAAALQIRRYLEGH